MKVVCVLDEVMKEIQISNRELGRLLDIDERTIEKLRSRTIPWQLKKEYVSRLTRWLYDQGWPGLFEVRHHPIWNNFGNTEVSVFRGGVQADAEVEVHLGKFLRRIESGYQPHIDIGEAKVVEQAIKTQNCVFIGSPKVNPATEIAMASLWGARAFDRSSENRNRIPIHFVGMGPANPDRPSAVLSPAASHSLKYRADDWPDYRYGNVDWLPRDKYQRFKGFGDDAAAVIFCRQPLGTDRPVSTLIIAGYTGFATSQAMRQATHQDIPFSGEDSEQLGQAEFAVLQFKWTKARGRGRVLGERKLVPDSLSWFPPWPSWESVMKLPGA